MASFFTRALDRITPWNRGGEVQRRKKREEEENRPAQSRNSGRSSLSVDIARPNQTIEQPRQVTPTAQRPENLFQDLNQSLMVGRPSQVVDVLKTNEVEAAKLPEPGTVVQPLKVAVAQQRELRAPSGRVVVPDRTATTQVADIERPNQGVGNRVRDLFDANTQSDKYRRATAEFEQKNQEMLDAGLSKEKARNTALKIARSNMDRNETNTLQSYASNVGRSVASVASNAAGGAVGIVKGVAQIPAGVLSIPKLMRLGAAKLTHNEEAEANIANDKGVLSELVRKYDQLIKPLTDPLTEAELATDRAAEALAPWAPGYVKPLTKGVVNVLPVKAAVAGLNNLSRTRNLQRLAADPEIVATAPTPPPVVNIPVSRNVDVAEDVGDALDVPVRVAPSKPNTPIREFPGDRPNQVMPTPDEVVARRVRAAYDNQARPRPDRSIEGIETNPAKIITSADKAQTQIVLDDYLRVGKITEEDHARLSAQLAKTPAADDAVSKGRKIEVKQVSPIDVKSTAAGAEDDAIRAILGTGKGSNRNPALRKLEKNQATLTDADRLKLTGGDTGQAGLEMAPDAKAEMLAKFRAQASQGSPAVETPVVSKPVALPKEVQDVLDNPKQFSKRQVAAARNQRDLARKYAKTQEQTAEAMGRIRATDIKKVEGQPEGFAPTGEFKVGKRGNVSETATRATEAQAGTREMADRSVDDLLDEISTKETMTAGDRRRISAAKENLMKADPEGFRSTEKYRLLDTLEKASRSDLARGLALIPRTIRKTANSDALTARWERKVGNVLDDPSKMTDAQWKAVQGANDNFTQARNTAAELEERFKRTGSEADFKAWESAHNAARKADTDAKMTEVKIAQQILKGEKGADVTKTIDNLKKEADVNTMDFVTANMLSGTGTGFRNTFGTELAGIENRIGANVRAKVVKGLFGENVGGYSRQGARFGRKLGAQKWFGDIKRRAENGGKNPIEMGKNWATAINSGGESSIQSQVYSRLAKYYKNELSDQGLSGKDLDLRMRHAMMTDPDNMAETFLDSTMKSSGLTGLFEKGQTIEKAVTDYVGRHTDSKFSQGASKLVMRLAVGFPTATTNFLYQSGKRLTAGLPSYIETGVKLARGDKAGAARAFDRALKETGSGVAVLGLGVALGKADMISGSYPTDPEERERWAREGITENSIKIGGAWYPIPQGAGMFGLPLLTGAAIGREGDSNESVKAMYSPKNLAKLLPTDQIQGFLNMASGDGAPQDFKNFVASGVRATTPVGALLNQISKSFDDTKNDTTTKSLGANIMDQIYSGIPGLNNAMDIPDKTDADGNPIQNPNPLQLAFGASSAVQLGGEQRSREIDAEVTSALAEIDQYGLLTDPNLEGVLEGTALEALKKANSGKKVDAGDVEAIKEGLVKGVSSEGTDTAYLEREQYDTNLAVLKLKRDIMKADKTVKPSSLQDIETAIKRGEVYKEMKMPYETIADYKSVGVEEWRKMGDPESDEYDPDRYQQLYAIDQLMTERGVSYRKGALDKAKYFLKESTAKGGRGGSGGPAASSLSSDFGTLKKSIFTPQVQAYDSIDQKSGSVPIIRRTRPNIVHKISSSR